MASPRSNFSSTNLRARATFSRASGVTPTRAPSTAIAAIDSSERCLPSRSTVADIGLERAPVHLRGFDERRSVLDHDRLVVLEHDLIRVARVRRTVHPDRELVAARRLHARGLRGAQVHAPDVEELAERERPLDGRFDMDE